MEYMGGRELEQGLIYQDFATDVLYKHGICLNAYSSKKYNIEKGESVAGIEIKNDKNFRNTGNLYIELYERQSTSTDYIEGGVLRKDNTIIWFIGDFDEVFLLSKLRLRYLCNKYQEYGFRYVETPTSKGVLIPVKYILENCEYIAHYKKK